MNDLQKENFNIQIRKLLKKFGITAHNLVQKRFDSDVSPCKISLKLEIDSSPSEEISTIIKIN